MNLIGFFSGWFTGLSCNSRMISYSSSKLISRVSALEWHFISQTEQLRIFGLRTATRKSTKSHSESDF